MNNISPLYRNLWPKYTQQELNPELDLFYRSNNPLILQERRLVTFIGSRKCTPYGYEVCRKLISGLSEYPVAIVSGLAYGIDQYSHEMALEFNIPTVSIIGSSLEDEYIYPKCNRFLAQRILSKGGMIISQYEYEHHPQREDFIKRNYLLASFSEMTIVIEAGEKSGTLWTVNFAADLNKSVGAVPGSINSEMSLGNNNLIKEGAYLISSTNDILDVLKIQKKESVIDTLPSQILNTFEFLISKKELEKRLNRSSEEISPLLTALEGKGYIQQFGEKIIKLV